VLVAERYRLGDPLGRGGMGEVHRATDEILGRQVAIKLLLPVRESLAARERFQREARAAAMISDTHVVAAFDFGSYEDGYFLAMELVEGDTVSAELRKHGPLPAERAVAIVRQAAAGLAAAPRLGIVHRDIKPGNLMLTSDGTVKVADFGIARVLGDPTTTLTATGQIVGTSHYLAPERALGRPAEPPSDVYALGCVLYQLVTGQPPFQADDPAAIMYQHVETSPVRPSELRPQLTGEFEDLLFWMLAKDPAQRPTAAQVAAGSTPPVIVAEADTVTEAQQVLTAPERRAPSRKTLAGVGAAVVLAAAVTVGLLLGANFLKLPTTNEFAPGSVATIPVSKPSTPTSVRPVIPPRTTAKPTTSSRPTTSSKPTPTAGSTDQRGPSKSDKKGSGKGSGGDHKKSKKSGSDD
jgi:serine/threonine protein kinase